MCSSDPCCFWMFFCSFMLKQRSLTWKMVNGKMFTSSPEHWSYSSESFPNHFSLSATLMHSSLPSVRILLKLFNLLKTIKSTFFYCIAYKEYMSLTDFPNQWLKSVFPGISDYNAKLSRIYELVKSLPQANHDTMALLFEHLHRFALFFF